MSTQHGIQPRGAGKSSFDLIDAGTLFKKLELQEGMTFLDLACGRGLYSLKASEFVGPSGRVYAVDAWKEGIEDLKVRAAERNIDNIEALVSDAGRSIAIDNHTVDVCLMATVLHDFVEDQISSKVLQQVASMLKTDGILAIIEFKKIDGPPGPPKHIRLAPEEVARLLDAYGFRKKRITDLGPFTYLMLFDGLARSPKTPSPLMKKGWGEGE
jgi:ubiquinone/menaquinone biosynthesis C-methylase UbiE